MSAPNLHPVRALEQRYPTLYRRRMLPCGAEIIQGRPGTRAYDKHDWDYASAADELIALYDELASRRAEYADCIPTGTDGKLRLHRCTVIGEKALDYVKLGLVKREPAA